MAASDAVASGTNIISGLIVKVTNFVTWAISSIGMLEIFIFLCIAFLFWVWATDGKGLNF